MEGRSLNFINLDISGTLFYVVVYRFQGWFLMNVMLINDQKAPKLRLVTANCFLRDIIPDIFILTQLTVSIAEHFILRKR